MQNSGPITTETSKSEGRLKEGIGCPHGRKKCLKCLLKRKKDGKGGVGYLDAPGYGTTNVKTLKTRPTTKMTRKSHVSTKLTKSSKMKGMKTLRSTMSSLGKKMRFKKVIKNTGKIKSLKSIIKGII